MPGGMDRPYLKSSISHLEALFDQAQSDIESLRALDHELGHRTTDRATRLRSKVVGLLAPLSVTQVSAACRGRVPHPIASNSHRGRDRVSQNPDTRAAFTSSAEAGEGVGGSRHSVNGESGRSAIVPHT
jgi:hypothetical protein